MPRKAAAQAAPADPATQAVIDSLPTLDLCFLARVIRREWKPRVHPWAEPYVQAMATLSSLDDSYGMDSGRDIVNRFLGNASAFRGPIAQALKSDLKRRLGRK